MRLTRSRQRLAILVLLLLAFGLRFYRLDAQSFWNDEGNSARLSERSVSAIIEGTASDIHPPLYYLLLRGWRELAGHTEFGLRSFSAFVGVGTVAVTMALARAVGAAGRKFSTSTQSAVPIAVAGLLTAVSPPLIYYSQEARMYALLAFLAALATWLLFRTVRAGPPRPGIRFTLYFVTVTAGLYTHYFFPAILTAHGLFLGGLLLRDWRRRSSTRRHPFFLWLGAIVAAGMLYLPWLPIFIRQAGGRPGVYAPLLSFFTDSLRWLTFGATVGEESVTWSLGAAGLLLVGGVLSGLMGNGRFANLLPLLMLLIPMLFMLAAGTTQPEFYKFILVSTPFLAILIAQTGAIGKSGQNLRWLQPPILTLLFLVLLSGTLRSLRNLYFNPAYARADYRGMAARIQADEHADAGVILNAPNQWEVFTYYFPDVDRVYPLPRDQPNPAVLEPALAEIAAKHERIYAIFWGEAQRDPQRLVERWLDAHAFKATEEWWGDVRFVVYAVPEAAAQEMETAVALPFGSHVTLRGYTLRQDTLQSGDIIQVTLFWESDARLEQRYKVFLHLLDAEGGLVAQRDSEPGGGLALTTTWQPGNVTVDNHGILVPVDTPPGTYTLQLGLYDVTDPSARLLIETDQGTVDAFPLATIQVE